MNKKNNQRFRETELRMEYAMLDLMKNTAFEKISVTSICEKACVNRSTFYAHFIDIYDMLNKLEQEVRKELLNSYKTTENQIFSEPSFIQFLKHIRKHEYFYKIILQTRTSFPLKQGYEQLWNIIEPRCRKAGIKNDEEILYYYINFQAGFTMMLKHWVDTGCKMSEQEVASMIRNCLPHVLVQKEY